MSLKQPDGSFLVAHHSEVDVRYASFHLCRPFTLLPLPLSSGIYCLLVIATLLDLLTPELVEGTASFIASSQTYEGGFSSSSQPYYSLNNELLSSPRPPLGEAHGGYTFCALASWILLQPFVNTEPDPSKRPHVNLKNLLRWLVQAQGTDIELGGFKGRTNKLVDGCYSWWCGGAFALLEGLGVGGSQNIGSRSPEDSASPEEGWDDIDGQQQTFPSVIPVDHRCRLAIQSESPSRLYSLRGPAPCWGLARQTTEVIIQMFFQPDDISSTDLGMPTRTIPCTASQACPQHSTMSSLLHLGVQRFSTIG